MYKIWQYRQLFLQGNGGEYKPIQRGGGFALNNHFEWLLFDALKRASLYVYRKGRDYKRGAVKGVCMQYVSLSKGNFERIIYFVNVKYDDTQCNTEQRRLHYLITQMCLDKWGK